MSHAPGPWVVQGYVNYVGWSIYAGTEGCIAERWYPISMGDDFNDRMRDNAHLIAAAPLLLEAAEAAAGAIFKWTEHGNAEVDAAYDHLVAAINAAKGNQ